MHNLNVQHDINNHLFFTKVKGGMAHLAYERVNDKCLNFVETHVPTPSKGLGVERHLIESALAYAKERDMAVKPTCPVVKEVIESSGEFRQLVRE